MKKQNTKRGEERTIPKTLNEFGIPKHQYWRGTFVYICVQNSTAVYNKNCNPRPAHS